MPQFQKAGGLVALDGFEDGAAYVEARSGATGHARVGLGHGEHAKQTVYAACIRHLLTDLLAAIDHARPPRVDLDAATKAVAVAAAATEATRTASTVQLAETGPE